ncbi:MAG TPA: hypothetical protein PKN48_06215 [Bacteroidales bacterium]|nr:hypothetical protein [Bacteroidales bacterium]
MYQILTEKETDSVFTDKIKAELGIDYTIFRAYYYKDLSGEHYLLLTEREYKRQNAEPLNDTIKAFNLKKQEGKLIIDWILRDFIMAKNKADTPEYSIWFWTKYFDLQDFDGDGLIDPVIVYGTSGNNDTEDGRIKIIVYYKGLKHAIRHQNGPLDFERNTQVDAKFYDLPKQIQVYVKGLMDKMTENNNAIFPYGYKEKMDAKKTYFDENK